jgi:hypothetical protein
MAKYNCCFYLLMIAGVLWGIVVHPSAIIIASILAFCVPRPGLE